MENTATTQRDAIEAERFFDQYVEQANKLYDVLEVHNQDLAALKEELHEAIKRLEEEVGQGT